ncbi:MAG: RnfH family protein [Rhodanobacteraceae bacterium]
MPDPRRIRVAVIHAEPAGAFRAELTLPAGATVADAIDASGIRTARPDIEIHAGRLGVFARKAKPGTRLRDGDRVEIYRALRIDPKEARRKRAQGNRSANERK